MAKAKAKSAPIADTPHEVGALTLIRVPPLEFRLFAFRLTGNAPYCQARFTQKAQIAIAEKMEKGGPAKKDRNRSPRDFNADFEAAKHVSEEGWVGIPASAIRNAMISACRLVNYKMTIGKLSLFCEADGIDEIDATPLIRIYGRPEPIRLPVRNSGGGMDLRCRPIWRNWHAFARIKFDSAQFTPADVFNLFQRAGQQVGIGEGRPDSKMSAGLGFGTFDIQAVNAAEMPVDLEQMAAE